MVCYGPARNRSLDGSPAIQSLHAMEYVTGCHLSSHWQLGSTESDSSVQAPSMETQMWEPEARNRLSDRCKVSLHFTYNLWGWSAGVRLRAHPVPMPGLPPAVCSSVPLQHLWDALGDGSPRRCPSGVLGSWARLTQKLRAVGQRQAHTR